MSPEIKQLILKNFEFFVTAGAFLVWMVLIRYNWPIIAMFRKLVLAAFTVMFFRTYTFYMDKVIAYLDQMDLDVLIRRHFVDNKGTDWVDGFFWGVALSIFAGIVLALWAKDFTTKGK
jgi:hypothetical protein